MGIQKVQIVRESPFGVKLLLGGIIAAPFVMIAGAVLKTLKIALIVVAVVAAVVVAFYVLKGIAKAVWRLILPPN